MRPTSLSRRLRPAAVGVAVAAALTAALVPASGLPGAERPAQAATVAPPAGWIDALNALRAEYGSPAVVEDARLTAGAEQHALYMAEHRSLQRDQDPARARHTPAGRTAARGSLLAGPANGQDTPAEFLDLWSRGAFTMLALLHPSLKRVGYGQSHLGASDYAALDVHSGRAAAPTSSGWPRRWPSATRAVRATTYSGGELPDPVAGCGAAPAGGWGLPLVVSYGPGARPTKVAATLAVDGTAVGVCVVGAHDSSDAGAVARLDEARSVLVVPRGPLRPGRCYTGAVTSSRGRVALRFRVAADLPAVPRTATAVRASAPTAVVKGRRATVTGSLAVGSEAAGSRAVELWSRAGDGAWTRTARRDFPVRAGRVPFRFTTAALRATTRLEVRFRGTAVERAAISAQRRVAVRRG